MEDAFVNVWFDGEGAQGDTASDLKGKPDFYSKWSDQASARFSSPLLAGADALRRQYPKHSLLLTTDQKLDILTHPGVHVTPLDKTPLITNNVFLPIARGIGAIPGVLAELVQFGAFNISWNRYDYLLFVVQFPSGFGTTTARYILHNGPEDPSRSLLIAVGAWSVQLHDEIWVFNEGYWQKNHELWTEIQKGDWKDVILKEDFKKALQKDVYGFFASEKIYKNLSIPWKRGLIMHGPPGNGKTISIKVIMKTCEEQGFTPLYVKSFKSFMGEETAMADVFNHARQMSPCVLILEDLDSLINDQNRSFFLNQIDGLTGNDGLLVIGTTNHFDRLDPGLSSRPSRFDRKFKFDDPDQEERALYAKYWQHKLKDNKEITFPDELVQGIAEATEHFSFAYLKEAFVSSLVELASYDGEDKPTFETLIKCQIKTLRKELGHADVSKPARTSSWLRATNREIPAPAHPVTPYLSNGREGNSVFDSILESVLPRGMRNAQPGPSGEHNRLFVDSVVSDPARIRAKPTGDCLPPSKVVDKNLSGRLKETDRDLVQRMEQLKTSLPGLGQDGAFRYANMLGSSSDGPSRGRRPAALGYGADLA